jgi:nitrate reductase molybdenum cofactor assembly chaperone
MTMVAEKQPIFLLFARLFDYPTPGLARAARECARLVEPFTAEAATSLSGFADFAEKTSLGHLQEIYTGAFDLKAAFQPYVGYHLFGDTYNRSPFLVGLTQRYRDQGFSVEKELPDHLAVMLRFLSKCTDAVLADELIQEALLPALRRMTHANTEDQKDSEEIGVPIEQEAGQNIYLALLQALQGTLQVVSATSEPDLAS